MIIIAVKDFFKKLMPKVGTEKPSETEAPKVSPNTCALCQKEGADKKWMGQYWHKQCLRSAKKMAKKMI